MFDLGKIIDFFTATTYTAAGTSTITSAEYALSPDFDHVLVVAKIGTAATDNTLGINGATSSGGSFSLLGTAVAAGATNTVIVKEIKNCQHGWIKTVLTRATSTTIEGVWVFAYKSKSGATAPASWTTNASYNMQVAPTAA